MIVHTGPHGRSLVMPAGAAALGAVAGALARCSPTGIAGWDLALTGLFVAVVVVAAARGPWWAVVPLAVPAVAVAGSMEVQLAALVAIVCLGAARAGIAPAGLRASAAALATVGLLHLPPMGAFGLPSLVVAGALVPLGLTTAAALLRHRAALRIVLGTGTVAVALAAVAGWQLQQARVEVIGGSLAARQGLEAARDGNPVLATSHLQEAARALDQAHRRLAGWWLAPVRLVPLAGPNLAALEAATRNGAVVADRAATVTTSADVGQLRAVDGQVDLALVRQTQAPLAELQRAIEQARRGVAHAGSAWLVPPVRQGLAELDRELDEAGSDAARADLAVRALPLLLGDEGLRRYLVLFANPSEARELGGIMASYVELEADRGSVRVAASGSAGELNQLPPSTLADPSAYPVRFLLSDPQRWATNWAGMPDLQSVTRAAAELYPSRGGRPIDGVLYIDPEGVAAVLGLTGPLEVPGVPYPLTADNVAQFLLADQYRLFDDHDGRRELLTDLATQVFDHLLRGDIPGPSSLGAAFGPAVRHGHLQMESLDPRTWPFLASVLLRRSFPTPDGRDLLAVVHANGAANKLDTYLRRSVDYDVRIDPASGWLTARAAVTLRNDASAELPGYVLGVPVDGVPGTNLVQLSIYSPHGLQEVRVDGRPVAYEAQLELGFSRYLVVVAVPPGGSVHVAYDLHGRVDLAQGAYRLTLVRQPTVHPDDASVAVAVHGARGTGPPRSLAIAASGSGSGGSFSLSETTELVAPLG